MLIITAMRKISCWESIECLLAHIRIISHLEPTIKHLDLSLLVLLSTQETVGFCSSIQMLCHYS